MHVHDTYFVIAHFHFIMVGGMVMALYGRAALLVAEITGRLYSEWWSRLAALFIFVGFFLTFLPQFVVGYSACRAATTPMPPEFQVLNVMSTAGARSWPSAICCRCSICLLSSATASRPAPNPWNATGLEWQTPSPPPPDNFAVDAGGCARALSIPPGEGPR